MRGELPAAVLGVVVAAADAGVVIDSANRSLVVETSLVIFEEGASDAASDQFLGAGAWNVGLEAFVEPYPNRIVHGLVGLTSNVASDSITGTGSFGLEFTNISSGLATGRAFGQVLMLVTFTVTEAQPFVFEASTQSPGTVFLSGPGAAIGAGFDSTGVATAGVLAPGQYRLEAEVGVEVEFSSLSGSGGTGQLSPFWDLSLRFVPAPGSAALLVGAGVLAGQRRRG